MSRGGGAARQHGHEAETYEGLSSNVAFTPHPKTVLIMLTCSAGKTVCVTSTGRRVRLHVARQNRHEDAAGNQRSRRSAHQAVLFAHLIPAGHCTVITETDHQMPWP